MDPNSLKRLLAGLSIAGLLAGTSLTLTGCPKPPPDTGEQTPGQSSSSGEKSGAGSAPGKSS